MKKRALMTLVLLPFLASCGEKVDLYERGSAIRVALNLLAKTSYDSNFYGDTSFGAEHYHLVEETTSPTRSITKTADFSSKGYFHLGEVRKETQSDSSVKLEQTDTFFVILEDNYYRLSSHNDVFDFRLFYSNQGPFFSDLAQEAFYFDGFANFRSILSSYLSSLHPGTEVSTASSSSGKIESRFLNVASKAEGNLSFSSDQTVSNETYQSQDTAQVSFDNYLPISFHSTSSCQFAPSSLFPESVSFASETTCSLDWSRYEEVTPTLSNYPVTSTHI